MQFHCPTRIVTGPGALDILKTFHAKRVLVVTDQFFAKSGKALEIGRRVPGAQVEIFDQVVPDPPAELAARGAALCERLRPELLIALGGGSPMDCAKGIRLASSLPMTFAAVPTTSGSLHEQRKSGNPSTTPTEPGFRKSVRMRTSFSEPQNVTSPQLQKRRLKTTT